MSGLVFFTLSAFLLCALLLGLSRLFAPKDPHPSSSAKTEDYECGAKPLKKKSSVIPIQFFLTALLFVIFDIEIIFMYPFAIHFRKFLETEQGIFAFLALGLFLLIFIYGLIWEIKSKALNWK